MEEDNSQIDKNKFIDKDTIFKMLDDIIMGVKSLIEMGVRVNLQVDNSKVHTENKQTVRIIIHYGDQAPRLENSPQDGSISESGEVSEEAWNKLEKKELPENPFSDLPECEEQPPESVWTIPVMAMEKDCGVGTTSINLQQIEVGAVSSNLNIVNTNAKLKKAAEDFLQELNKNQK